MGSAVRGQHKPFCGVSGLNPRDAQKFVRCAIEGADCTEPGGPRIEASALPAIGRTSDARTGPMLFVRDDLEARVRPSCRFRKPIALLLERIRTDPSAATDVPTAAWGLFRIRSQS